MKTQERSVIFDYLKAICIILVIITHLDFDESQRQFFLFPFVINMAVPIFMVITGYVNMMSVKNKNMKISEWYSFYNFFPKLLSIMIPYFFVFFIFVKKKDLFVNGTIKQILIILLKCEWGKGSYYVPIMIQFIIFFPLMFNLVEKLKYKGYVILISLNILLEFLFTYFELSADIYRLSFFRYIIFVCAGMFLYSAKPKIKKSLLIISFGLGFLYIMAIMYFGYSPKLFTNWITTSFPIVFYILPIMFFIVDKEKYIMNFKLWKIFEKVGQSTYHIYLVQMLWYCFWGNQSSSTVMLIPNIIVCIILGVIFAEIDKKFIQYPTKSFLKKLKKV